MNVALIRKHLGKGGPHVVRTSDGNGYRVPHPEFVLIGRHNLVIEEDDGNLEILDPVHVVAIRRLRAKNGK